MRTWWWGNNFGDKLTEYILTRLGIDVTWVEPWDAEFIGIGSVAHRIPSNFEGYVWGTGVMFRGNPHLGCSHDLDLNRAKVLAVRGHDSREEMRLPVDTPLGDAGLALRAVAKMDAVRRHKLGVLPHFDDHHLAALHPDALIIDPLSGPEIIVPALASCSRLITSCLHGLVAADALGLESLWSPYDPTPQHSRKFFDYGSGIDSDMEPMQWRLADQGSVEGVVQHLVTSLEDIDAGI